MKGIVTIDLNERQQQPGVNAPISRFYSKGDKLEITDAVLGDTYDGDDLWYKLKDGSFVWGGGVEVEPEGIGKVPEDKDQYLISYRKRRRDLRIDMDSKEEADELSFAPVRLPTSWESIRVNKLEDIPFATGVTQAVSKLPASRKHVFIYIHGYQLFASLALDLFTSFVDNYMSLENPKIAKAIFMVWPAQGLSRKKADDRAVEAGEQFTANNLFSAFTELSDALNKEQRCLNLIVHSFGHQLLNGMLNPLQAHKGKIPNKKIFENIFLMASDVTYLAAQKDGFDLKNVFSGGRESYKYDYKLMDQLSNNVHVYHDHHDYLLYTSTRKFVGNRNADETEKTKNYRNLGNYGPGLTLPPLEVYPNMTFHKVADVVALGARGDLCHFPYQSISERAQDEIKEVLRSENYDSIKDIRVILNRQRFTNHHRYLFTCKAVVDHIHSLL